MPIMLRGVSKAGKTEENLFVLFKQLFLWLAVTGNISHIIIFLSLSFFTVLLILIITTIYTVHTQPAWWLVERRDPVDVSSTKSRVSCIKMMLITVQPRRLYIIVQPRNAVMH